MLDVREPAQTFRFAGIATKPVPSLLRGFSAPVHVEFDYAAEELAFLAAHDSDPVNRWDAAQRSFTDAILALARDHREGRPLALPDSLAGIVRMLLADRVSDPALLALALTPPDLGYVAAIPDVIDVDGVVAARDFVRSELARALLRRVRARVRRPARPRVLRADARRRPVRASWRTSACATSGDADDAAGRALAVAQFDAADNMTDSIAALAALTDGVSPERDALFARFEAKWRDEPLVLDKWFALEAMSGRTDTLERVRKLLAHPRFNARNPNRVRSLVGAFTLRNFARFNAARRRGLRVRRGPGAGARRDQPAARGDDRRRVQPVEALPRAAARPHAGHAAADRAGAGPVARRHRSRDAHAGGLTPRASARRVTSPRRPASWPPCAPAPACCRGTRAPSRTPPS